LVAASIALTPARAAASSSEALVYGYAGMSTEDVLVPFELATSTAVSPAVDLLPEGNYPYDATVHPEGHEVWVVGASGDGVVVVDTTTNTVVQRINLGSAGDYPVDVLFGLGGAFAYVSARDGEAMLEIDTATYSLTGRSIPFPANLGPGKMALNPKTGQIYLVDWYDGTLYEIDPTTMLVTDDNQMVGGSLWDLIVDSAGSNIYVTDRSTDQVHVVSTSGLAVVTSVLVGDDPWGIDITPDDALVFVANEDSHDVTVIDTATNTATASIFLTADADPRDLEFREDGFVAYVPSGTVAGDDGVFVIGVTSLSVIDTVTLGGPSNTNVVAVKPQRRGFIFADGFESGDLSAWSLIVP
jgi:YVTN family beta-propeller protein